MNRDLFLAILSMDSYNRGYDAWLLDPPAGRELHSRSGTFVPVSLKSGISKP